MVTTSERRLQNLMQQTAHVVRTDTRYFFFTHFGELKAAVNVLTDPIWYQFGHNEPSSILLV